MSVSRGRIALALILGALCIGLWYKRSADFEREINRPITSTPARAVSPTPTADDASSSSLANDGTAAVIATIDWADPGNPVAIPISWRGNRFLFDTRDGVRIWRADTRKMETLETPLPKARLLDHVWMRVHDGNYNGTLFAVSSGDGASTLYVLPNDVSQVSGRFDLPAGFMPSNLIRLSESIALICSATAGRSLFVSMAGNNVRPLDPASSHDHMLDLIRDAGIVGRIDGLGQVGNQGVRGDRSYERPLLFDANSCGWVARGLPEPLASATQLELVPRLNPPSFLTTSITAARWVDKATGQRRVLEAPLFWNLNERQWSARQAADYPMLVASQLWGMTEEQWSFAADLPQGKFAFLSPVDARWREAKQRLPATENLKLLPIGSEGVLVLLIDSRQPGRVVRLDPAPEMSIDTRFPGVLSRAYGYIDMRGVGLMMANGREVNHVAIIRASGPALEQLPDVPQPSQHLTGVELGDGSIVVFGGLHPRCNADDLDQCPHGAQPGFRWLPEEKRWQPLPTLTVPFAFGQELQGDNSGYLTRYRRSDFVVDQGRDLYFLSSRPMKPGPGAVWGATQLIRWSVERGMESLAATKLDHFSPTLLKLNDRRLAAIGGSTRNELPSPSCQACTRTRAATVARLREKAGGSSGSADSIEGEDSDRVDPEQVVPPCEACSKIEMRDHYALARSSELYDARTNRWSLGPYANYPGGRAVKLANGRVFKIGMVGYFASDADFGVETADAALTQWTPAPPFPFPRPTEVSSIVVIGNQVLLVMARPGDRVVIWDDDSRSWKVQPLPRHSNWSPRETPKYLTPVGDHQLLVVYERNYEVLPWPLQ
jgi:hypothetical protein